jgi:hypothetical protein
MNTFKLAINCEHISSRGLEAPLVSDWNVNGQVADYLRALADRLESDKELDEGTIRDVNGNRVGEWIYVDVK